MTRSETRTLASTAGVLLVAGVVRTAAEMARPAPEIVADTVSVPALAEASAAALDESRRRSAPLDPGELLDIRSAPEEELDRLPGVGPSVARAIVQAREGGAVFRSSSDLTRVRGIGSATASRIADHVAFEEAEGSGAREPPQSAGWRTEARVRGGVGADGGRDPREAPYPLDLNDATESELLSVTGIGPVLAQRIIDMRDQVGRFRRVDDLIDVRGIGPAKLQAIRGQLVVRR